MHRRRGGEAKETRSRRGEEGKRGVGEVEWERGGNGERKEDERKQRILRGKERRRGEKDPV